jgi:hypothetical protein
MKVFCIVVAASLLCTGQFGCKKDKFDAYSGSVTALKNGIAWSPLVRGNSSDASIGRFNLYMDQYDGDAKLNGLILINIPFSGKHRVYKFSSTAPPDKTIGHYFDTYDGHALCTTYDVFENDSVSNYIEITSYDSRTNTVKGNFGLKLYLTGMCASGYPDTLIIKNGVFETTVKP